MKPEYNKIIKPKRKKKHGISKEDRALKATYEMERIKRLNG
jgi:hypothetical protein